MWILVGHRGSADAQVGTDTTRSGAPRASGARNAWSTGEKVTGATSGHTLLVSWDMGSSTGHRITADTSGAHRVYLRSARC